MFSVKSYDVRRGEKLKTSHIFLQSGIWIQPNNGFDECSHVEQREAQTWKSSCLILIDRCIGSLAVYKNKNNIHLYSWFGSLIGQTKRNDRKWPWKSFFMLNKLIGLKLNLKVYVEAVRLVWLWVKQCGLL